jgi:hypothetical protein
MNELESNLDKPAVNPTLQKLSRFPRKTPVITTGYVGIQTFKKLREDGYLSRDF